MATENAAVDAQGVDSQEWNDMARLLDGGADETQEPAKRPVPITRPQVRSMLNKLEFRLQRQRSISLVWALVLLMVSHLTVWLFSSGTLYLKKKNELGSGTTILSQMIAVGKFDVVSDLYARNSYRADVALFVTDKLETFKLNVIAEREEISARLLAQGLRPATIEQLLAWAAQNPHFQRWTDVCATGTVLPYEGRTYVPCLSRSRGGERVLTAYESNREWNPVSVILATRP